VLVPGAVGAVSLLLGLYGTSQLPVRVTGVLLLVLAVALIAAEAHLGAGGVLVSPAGAGRRRPAPP
jgi:membrane-bound serine protease (ClpP class)